MQCFLEEKIEGLARKRKLQEGILFAHIEKAKGALFSELSKR